jgi:predicted PurR-regulated permease PerM
MIDFIPPPSPSLPLPSASGRGFYKKIMTNPQSNMIRNWLLGIAALLAFAWLLGSLSPILTPFIAAAIVAYILNPIVLKLCAVKLGKKTLARTLASAVVMVLLIVVLVGVALIVLPVLRTEAALLQARLPTVIEQANSNWLPWIKQHLGIALSLDTALFKNWFIGLSAGDDVVNQALTVVKAGGTALLGFVGTSLLALVLAFYLLMDWPEIVERVKQFVPQRWSKLLTGIAADCDRVLGQYLRGQLSVMLALCVYYSTALWITGFDVALPVGVLTGLLIVIPYLGFALGFMLALAAAVLQFAGLSGLLWVAIIYGFGQILEGFFLTPRWVGASLGLHPAAVIFALLAFGQLMGFAGVLLALPLAAVVVVVGKVALARYVASDWYAQK